MAALMVADWLHKMTSQHELRVVVVTPTGRDGPLICNLLSSKGIACVNLLTAEAARIDLNAAAGGALILAEEALEVSDIVRWTEQVAAQPSWSDFPIILLTVAGEVDNQSQRNMLVRQPLGNLVLLERPSRPETLVSTIQAALRSRRRQYEIRDYLAQRQLTEETLRKAEKLAVVGRLAASIAHEINNPLESVINLLYLIGTSATLQDSMAHARLAESELARVSEIVTQTLRFHRQLSQPSVVQVEDLVESVLVLFGGRLVSARIAIEREFRESQPIVAMAGELRQVVTNLVGNALDAMGGGGTLKIRVANATERRNGARPGIRLTISDTGSGIHPEIKKKLFEPFVSTKGNTGCGLGLWVSSGIVQKHGGSIQVRSNALSATGSVFSIFLPAQIHFADASHSTTPEQCDSPCPPTANPYSNHSLSYQ
jgi:signal transduction histidine kinase